MTKGQHHRANRDPTRVDPCSPSRCRQVYVPDVGAVIRVPRHIVRLEGKRLRGWQVRFESPTKYFSDGAHGGPRRALAAAKEHLRRVWRPVEMKTSRGRNPVTRRPTTGVRLVLVVSGDSAYWYAEATHPRRGHSPKRFYIGTTRRPDRVKAARTKALNQRAKWLAEHRVPIR